MTRDLVRFSLLGLLVSAAPLANAQVPATQAQPSTPTGDVNFDLRLNELETRVNAFKQDVFRSKSRLFLLREQVLRRTIGGSKTAIEHRNELGAQFQLVDVAYILDGNRIEISSSLEDPRFSVFDASVLPGPHTLTVQMRFRGRNVGGAFSYMNELTLEKSANYAFTVDEGRTVALAAVAYDTGRGAFTDAGRFAIKFEVLFEGATREGNAAQGDAAPSNGQ
jgi:hypothetical protein